MNNRPLPRTLLLTALATASLVRTGAAQATLRGRVVDSELGQPIMNAMVRIRPGPAPFATDSLGGFEVRGLPFGIVELTIQQIGFEPGNFRLRLTDTVPAAIDFPLDFTGYRLPEIVVSARAEQLAPRYLDFEQRRHRGLGAYIRWDELLKKGFSSVGDALREVRGVRMECNQETFECFAHMARTPQCQPAWWIDGVQVHSFHENTPIRDVYGIEVYRGPGEVPGEYSGSNAMCGVIVIWTKSRPYRADQ